jgi:CheY-like chemotaxis protein
MTAAPGRVLVISDDAAARGWFATFLSSMGCQCVATSSGTALPNIRRGDCDAVLIDLRCSETSAEELVSEIEHSAPHLSGRILVLGDESAAPEAADPPRRQALLARLRRERLIEELWPTLKPLLAVPPKAGVATQMARIARRVYDSFRQPLPTAIRGHHPSSRQLVYRHQKTLVDMVIRPIVRSERIVLLGQILAAGEPTDLFADVPVALLAPAGSVVATRTNRLGEFSLEFDYIKSAELQLRFGEMLLVPLGDMDWSKRGLQ